ncbi:hypothetical protein C8J56DRAFT_903447 [Mycena floridula]|nr:hypothetical protein C8J56DRAFT_903447 [Mycena floridula]
MDKQKPVEDPTCAIVRSVFFPILRHLRVFIDTEYGERQRVISRIVLSLRFQSRQSYENTVRPVQCFVNTVFALSNSSTKIWGVLYMADVDVIDTGNALYDNSQPRVPGIYCMMVPHHEGWLVTSLSDAARGKPRQRGWDHGECRIGHVIALWFLLSFHGRFAALRDAIAMALPQNNSRPKATSIASGLKLLIFLSSHIPFADGFSPPQNQSSSIFMPPPPVPVQSRYRAAPALAGGTNRSDDVARHDTSSSRQAPSPTAFAVTPDSLSRGLPLIESRSPDYTERCPVKRKGHLPHFVRHHPGQLVFLTPHIEPIKQTTDSGKTLTESSMLPSEEEMNMERILEDAGNGSTSAMLRLLSSATVDPEIQRRALPAAAKNLRTIALPTRGLTITPTWAHLPIIILSLGIFGSGNGHETLAKAISEHREIIHPWMSFLLTEVVETQLLAMDDPAHHSVAYESLVRVVSRFMSLVATGIAPRRHRFLQQHEAIPLIIRLVLHGTRLELDSTSILSSAVRVMMEAWNDSDIPVPAELTMSILDVSDAVDVILDAIVKATKAEMITENLNPCLSLAQSIVLFVSDKDRLTNIPLTTLRQKLFSCDAIAIIVRFLAHCTPTTMGTLSSERCRIILDAAVQFLSGMLLVGAVTGYVDTVQAGFLKAVPTLVDILAQHLQASHSDNILETIERILIGYLGPNCITGYPSVWEIDRYSSKQLICSDVVTRTHWKSHREDCGKGSPSDLDLTTLFEFFAIQDYIRKKADIIPAPLVKTRVMSGEAFLAHPDMEPVAKEKLKDTAATAEAVVLYVVFPPDCDLVKLIWLLVASLLTKKLRNAPLKKRQAPSSSIFGGCAGDAINKDFHGAKSLSAGANHQLNFDRNIEVSKSVNKVTIEFEDSNSQKGADHNFIYLDGTLETYTSEDWAQNREKGKYW